MVKKFTTYALIAGIAFVGFVGGKEIANAASLFKDNDCGTSCYSDKLSNGTESFVYDTGLVSYKNGNYRLSKAYSTDSFYRWGISTNDNTNRMWNLSVWLDSNYYTSHSTRYYLSGNWAGTIDQYDAQPGYNWVGGANDYGVIQVAVNSRDYVTRGNTGADEVNIWY